MWPMPHEPYCASPECPVAERTQVTTLPRHQLPPSQAPALLQVPPLRWSFYGQFPRPPGCQPPAAAGFMGSVMSQRFKQPLVGAAGLALQSRDWPPVPGPHYASGLGPFTSCLFAGWVPDMQAGPGGCAGLQVGRQPTAHSPRWFKAVG